MAVNNALSDVEMAAEIRLQLVDVTDYIAALTARGYDVKVVTNASDSSLSLTIIKTISI